MNRWMQNVWSNVHMMGCQLQSVNNDSTYSMSRDLFEITSTVWNFRVPQIPLAQFLAFTQQPTYLPTCQHYNHQITARNHQTTARNRELLLSTNKERPYDHIDEETWHWRKKLNKIIEQSWKKMIFVLKKLQTLWPDQKWSTYLHTYLPVNLQ